MTSLTSPRNQAETSVLFELIAARYERRSMLITANQPFGEMGQNLPDQAMTLAAIDRLVITQRSWDECRKAIAVAKPSTESAPWPATCHATSNKTETAKN